MAERMGELFRQDNYGLSKDAGIEDIGMRPYGPLRPFEPDPALEQLETGEALRGVGSMVRPERFHEAVMRMPMSRNIHGRAR